VDVHFADRDGEGFGAEPRAAALRTGDVAHELFDLLAPVLGVRLRVAPLEVSDHPVELGHVLSAPPVAIPVRDVDPLSLRPIEDELLVLVGEVAPPRVEVYAVLLG
jgi:hypothetical protein